MNLRTSLAAAAILCALPALAFAQDHDHHQDHAAHGTQRKPAEPPQDYAGHDRHDQDAQDHAAHGAKAAPSPDQPRTPIPPITDADREAAKPPAHGHHDHGRPVGMLLFDRLEAWSEHGGGQAWEAQAWFGTDAHKLWLRSEGEREGGVTGAADLEVLYGRPIAPWWDLVAGVRQETRPGPSRTSAAFGVMGMAPYKFEVEATAYLDEDGRLSASAEAEYELLLTHRLILQPLIEAEWHARDDRERGIGRGLNTLEAGLRLRYEIDRRFAPYVGIVHERRFGRTADLLRDEGEDVEETKLVMGVRFWF
jgi:copper resistance protein B